MRNAGQVSSVKKKNQCEYLLSREPARALERKGQGPSAGSRRLAPQPQNSPPRPRRPQPPRLGKLSLRRSAWTASRRPGQVVKPVCPPDPWVGWAPRAGGAAPEARDRLRDAGASPSAPAFKRRPVDKRIHQPCNPSSSHKEPPRACVSSNHPPPRVQLLWGPGLKPGSGLLSALARGLSILMNVPGSFSLPQEMISPSSGPSAVRPGPQAPGEAPATARHQGHREPLGDQPPSARPPPAPPTRAPRTVPSCLSGPGSPGSPECHSHQGDPVRPARRDRGVSRARAPCHGATAESASLWRVLVRNGVLEGT